MHDQNRKARRYPGRAQVVIVLGIGVGSGITPPASAGELAFGVGYVGEYSDNIRRAPAVPEREWINSYIAGLAYREHGPSIDAYVMTQGEYRDFKYDTYNDGPLYYADVSALWRVSPQRLSWIFIDRYGQVTRDVTRADTRDNLVNSNVFSTGPDVFFRFSQLNTLVLGMRYGGVHYEDTDTDSQRYGTALRWLYAATPEITYSANVESQYVRYDNDILNDNYDRQDGFVRYDLRQAHTRLIIDAGATVIDRERAASDSGPALRFSLARRLSSESVVGVLAAGEFLDTGQDLLATATSPVESTVSLPPMPATSEVSGDLYFTKRAELYYGHSTSGYALDTRVFFRDIDYQVTLQDREEYGGRIVLTLNPLGTLVPSIYAVHQDTRYRVLGREDRDSQAGVRLLYRLNRQVGMTLDGNRNWRYSSDAFQEYVDRRVMFSLVYYSSALYVPARR